MEGDKIFETSFKFSQGDIDKANQGEKPDYKELEAPHCVVSDISDRFDFSRTFL